MRIIAPLFLFLLLLTSCEQNCNEVIDITNNPTKAIIKRIDQTLRKVDSPTSMHTYMQEHIHFKGVIKDVHENCETDGSSGTQ